MVLYGFGIIRDGSAGEPLRKVISILKAWQKLVYQLWKDLPQHSEKSRRSGWRLHEIWERLEDEWTLYNYHMLGVVMWTQVFVFSFFTIGALRNIAFYRHVPGSNLPDIMFDIIEENHNEFFKRIIEWLCYIIFLNMIFLCFIGNIFYQPPHKPRIFSVLYLVKMTVGYQIGLVLRAVLYLSTSIPGTASHCHPYVDITYWVRKPKSLVECFTFTNWSTPHCGDLIFSGHVYSTLFASFALEDGSRSILGWYPRQHKWIFRLLNFLTICQGCAVVAVRNHYSVDVILSLIFTPIYYHWYNKLRIFDIRPRRNSVKTEDDGDRLKRRRTFLDYFRSRSLFHAVYAVAMVGMTLYLKERSSARLREQDQ